MLLGGDLHLVCGGALLGSFVVLRGLTGSMLCSFGTCPLSRGWLSTQGERVVADAVENLFLGSSLVALMSDGV